MDHSPNQEKFPIHERVWKGLKEESHAFNCETPWINLMVISASQRLHFEQDNIGIRLLRISLKVN